MADNNATLFAIELCIDFHASQEIIYIYISIYGLGSLWIQYFIILIPVFVYDDWKLYR